MIGNMDDRQPMCSQDDTIHNNHKIRTERRFRYHRFHLITIDFFFFAFHLIIEPDQYKFEEISCQHTSKCFNAFSLPSISCCHSAYQFN